jgi:hypothetical protein
MTIRLEEIVYLHCHQQGTGGTYFNYVGIYLCIHVFVCVFLTLNSRFFLVDSGGTVVLVSQDGIQRPPLRFPRGGHLLQFLTCLETGLLPHGQLDPPLWSQRGKVSMEHRHVLTCTRYNPHIWNS